MTRTHSIPKDFSLLLRCIALGLLFVGLPLRSTAEPFPFRFEYITTAEGLSQNTIDYIFKDSKGFMWFATWNGLCRYDGYEFTIYKAGNGGSGLPDNFVHTLEEDTSGLLWVGTSQGLGIFDLNRNRFLRLEGLPLPMGKSHISALHPAGDGAMWIGTEKEGLIKASIKNYDPEEGWVELETRPVGLAGELVTSLAETGPERLWVGTRKGIWEVNVARETFRSISISSFPPIAPANIMAMFAEKGHVWIGSSQGLVQYKLSTGEETVYRHDPFDPKSLVHNSVTAITRDFANNLLVGTLGGLNIFNAGERNFLRITERAGSQPQLNNKFINALFSDAFGNVWIGTDKGGINKYNLHRHRFGAYVHDVAKANSLSHSTVNSIFAEDETLWVGSAGGGLDRINRKNNEILHFRHDPKEPRSLSSDYVSSILRDRSGHLWVGTWGSGLNKMARNKPGRFEHFPAKAEQASGLVNNFVSSIYEDPRGFLLVGTENGLDLMDPVHGTFQHFAANEAGSEITEVGCILLDRYDHYWIGTRKGLYRFPAAQVGKNGIDLRREDLQFFSADPEGDGSLPGNYIISLMEDQSGRIWVGTYGHGIAYGQPGPSGSWQFNALDEKDGLCNNVVYCMEQDLAGNIWLSTDYGLSRYKPETGSFSNYFESDGFLNNQYYWSASYKDKEGNLYFGGVNGLNFFKPEKIRENPYQPRATFTKLLALNSPVEVGEKRHGRVALKRSVDGADVVDLSYKDNVFSIEFSTLDYFLPEKVRFAYRMEGVDQEWVSVSSDRRFATYTNLKGGDYIFRVKASLGEGQWQDTPTELLFRIHPPFWSTTWFQLLMAIALAGGVLGYIRLRTHYLHAQTKRLEGLVNTRTREIETQKSILQDQAETLTQSNLMLEQRQSQIETQKSELEVKNSEISEQRDQLIELNNKVRLVNRLRLRFFTNISHEFRTPLTLIIDPIESLLERFREEEDTGRTLRIINRNAQRLLHLINQLMTFRRLEEGKTHARVAKGDLVNFVKNIYMSFHDLAEHQQVRYHFHLSNPQPDSWFDAEKLENIVYNLLSNAFKYTPPNGQVSLALNFDSNRGGDATRFVELVISDSGVGMEKEHQRYIFDHFYQAPTGENARVKGSGIGLALTRELVDIMHGEIDVSSAPGKGSVFRVRLPCSKNAFEDREIAADEPGRLPNLVTRVSALTEEVMLARQADDKVQAIHDDRSKPLILIVEDNYDLRSFLTQSLSPNFRVLEAENGKQGLDWAKKYTPDLIVSDIMMPRIDGLELCSRLKDNIQTSHIPVILLTAKTMVENWVDGLESGADDYIPKPFNLRILVASINNLLRSRHKLKVLFGTDPTPSAQKVTSNSLDAKFLEEVYAILEEHYTDQSFSIDQFAARMCISRSLLYKKVKSLTDMSITDLINFYKLKKAAQMLRNEEISISEAAYQCGFSDPKYFSRIFKKFYGMSPSEYAGVGSGNPDIADARLN